MPTNPAVILTQELADCERLSARLLEHGIISIAYPCIATRLTKCRENDLPCNRRLEDYKIVAFTSKRGVAGMLHVKHRLLDIKPFIACVGESTAHEVKTQLGLDCNFLPKEQTAKGLAQTMVEQTKQPTSVLHPRGNKSTGEFKATLEGHGWEVCELVVYENFAPEITPLNLQQDALAVFASPSAAMRFFETNPGLKENLICVAIGPTTAQSLSNLGIAEIEIAKQPTHESLVDTIKLKLSQGTKV